ncbi:MAG TPA: hypothetical protein VMG38_08210 [Trebonia sp.]|nr:hypothetical protein [Trebonia sp.]
MRERPACCRYHGYRQQAGLIIGGPPQWGGHHEAHRKPASGLRAEFLGPLAGLACLLLGALLYVSQVAELGGPQADPGFRRLFQSFCLVLTGEHF